MKLFGQSRPRAARIARLAAVPVALLTAGSLTALSLAGGASASRTAPRSASGTYYFVSHGCPTDTFWPPVWNGAADAAKRLGIHVDILHITQAECGSTAAEVNLLETAIAAHPAGIATTVTDPTAFSSALKTAAADHIPVVVFNSAPTANGLPNAANPYLAYVGQSNYSAGVGAAHEAVSEFHLKSGAKVIVIDHEPTNISLTQRLNGIRAGFRPSGITPTVIATSDDVSSGASIVGAYLTSHKGVDAILTLGTTGTDEAVQALTADSLHIRIGAFDLDSTTLAYIERGTVTFTVDQQPYLQGYLSIVELFLDKTEGAAPVNIPTGPAFLTSSNVKELGRFVNHTGF